MLAPPVLRVKLWPFASRWYLGVPEPRHLWLMVRILQTAVYLVKSLHPVRRD